MMLLRKPQEAHSPGTALVVLLSQFSSPLQGALLSPVIGEEDKPQQAQGGLSEINMQIKDIGMTPANSSCSHLHCGATRLCALYQKYDFFVFSESLVCWGERQALGLQALQH